MTEKRSDYRKKQQQQAHKNIFDRVKSAFMDNQDDDYDVQNSQEPASNPQRRSLKGNGEADEPQVDFENNDQAQIRNPKGLKLKKRLNQTILILIVLIVLVLLALFHL